MEKHSEHFWRLKLNRQTFRATSNKNFFLNRNSMKKNLKSIIGMETIINNKRKLKPGCWFKRMVRALVGESFYSPLNKEFKAILHLQCMLYSIVLYSVNDWSPSTLTVYCFQGQLEWTGFYKHMIQEWATSPHALAGMENLKLSPNCAQFQLGAQKQAYFL